MIGECAYCWHETELTTEHAFPSWINRKIPDSDSYAPVRERHMFGGVLTIEDVCARCNNGSLSRLDEYAEGWWDRNVGEYVTDLDADEPKLGRWLAKITYNMQRIGRRERSGEMDPPIPDDTIRWIIGEDRLHDSFGAVVGALPRGHHSAANAGHDSPLFPPIPLRWTHFQGLVFMTVWRASNWDISVPGMVRAICETMPGVALDLDNGRGSRRLPTILQPDFVEKGLYDNHELRIRLTEHWRAQEGKQRG